LKIYHRGTEHTEDVVFSLAGRRRPGKRASASGASSSAWLQPLPSSHRVSRSCPQGCDLLPDRRLPIGQKILFPLCSPCLCGSIFLLLVTRCAFLMGRNLPSPVEFPPLTQLASHGLRLTFIIEFSHQHPVPDPHFTQIEASKPRFCSSRILAAATSESLNDSTCTVYT